MMHSIFGRGIKVLQQFHDISSLARFLALGFDIQNLADVDPLYKILIY